MDILSEEIGDITVLTVQGHLTVDHGVASLSSMIRDIADSGRAKVVLDLGSVDFMDSLGLEALLSASTAMGQKGGRLALAGMNSRLRRLLEITHLQEVLETHGDRGEAVDCLTQASLR